MSNTAWLPAPPKAPPTKSAGPAPSSKTTNERTLAELESVDATAYVLPGRPIPGGQGPSRLPGHRANSPPAKSLELVPSSNVPKE